jgi:hypothetical protein
MSLRTRLTPHHPTHFPSLLPPRPLSNRHSMQLEIAVTHTKHSPDPISNRHKFAPFFATHSAPYAVPHAFFGVRQLAASPPPAPRTCLEHSPF